MQPFEPLRRGGFMRRIGRQQKDYHKDQDSGAMPRYPWMRSLIILHNASIDKTTTRHVGVGRNNWNKKNMQNLCRRSAVLGKESQGESRLPAPCNEPTKRRYCEIFKIEFLFLKQKNSLDATLRRPLWGKSETWSAVVCTSFDGKGKHEATSAFNFHSQEPAMRSLFIIHQQPTYTL